MVIQNFGAKIKVRSLNFQHFVQLIFQSKLFCNMKATSINLVNVSISLVYCLFGVVSFVVVKIATRQFSRDKGEKQRLDRKKIEKQDVEKLNFSRIFLKTFFLKSTLIGSVLNRDRKYLLRQMFTVSCIAVSCFYINTYIIWPFALGLSTFVTTFVLSDILIPVFSNNNKSESNPETLNQSNLKYTPSLCSNSIQIQHTELQLSVSNQRQPSLAQNQPKFQKKSNPIKRKLQLIYIVVLAIITQILICQSALTLTLSVSNSGVLNLISLGISVFIDQILGRITIGLITYLACLTLQKTQKINFFQSRIFAECFHEALQKELLKIYQLKNIQEMNKKIVNINNPSIEQNQSFSRNQDQNTTRQVATEMKMINHSVLEEVTEEVLAHQTSNLPVDALLEEDEDVSEHQEEQPQVEFVCEQNQNSTVKQHFEEIEVVKIVKKQETTSYFELFEHDLKMFEQIPYEQASVDQKPNKTKKKYKKPEQKFKRDPFLYFPYEEHKLSHKNPALSNLTKQPSLDMDFFNLKSSVEENYFSSIDVFQFNQDTIFNEEPSIGMVLQEKNINIRKLVVNEKPQIPPTARPDYSARKSKDSRDKQTITSVKKVSPYLTNLSSQVVKPHKSKKIKVSKNNKENANQVNKSFMVSEALQMSGINQKQSTLILGRNIQNQLFNAR